MNEAISLATSEAAADLAARIERYRPLVVAELRAVVGDAPLGLYAWMRYHLGWEDAHGASEEAPAGKMLRSTALLLAAELLGARVEEAVPAAAAVDLVHNFSLLHDDIEDNSATRRSITPVLGIHPNLNDGPRVGRAGHDLEPERPAFLSDDFQDARGIAPPFDRALPDPLTDLERQ